MPARRSVVLLLVALAGCGRSDAQAVDPKAGTATAETSPSSETPAPQFVASSDPAEPIIRVAYGQGFLMGLPASTYTLYGDGRLELTKRQTRFDAGAPPVPPPRSVVLDAEEMHSLVALAANPLLIEGRQEDLAQKLEAAGSLMQDSTPVTVEVRLASYARGTVALSPVARRFRMIDPIRAAQHRLGGEAVEALAAVVNGIARLHVAKAEQQRGAPAASRARWRLSGSDSPRPMPEATSRSEPRFVRAIPMHPAMLGRTRSCTPRVGQDRAAR